MKNSVVKIESQNEENRAFGTGFVVDVDPKGVYIVTCQHVIDDVVIPMVENRVAKILTLDDTGIDMAVLFVPTLKLKALPLQIEECNSLAVDVIGFSTFNKKSVTQKKHINAQLFEESMELFPEGKPSYKARQITADSRFQFYNGNSGSPVICKKSNRVIAMISNKEGSGIAYAVDIINLQKVWHDMPFELLVPIENISGLLDEAQASWLQKIPFKKYFFYFILMLLSVVIFETSLYKIEEDKLYSLAIEVNLLRADWENIKTHPYPEVAKKNLFQKSDSLREKLEDIDEDYLSFKSKVFKYEKISYVYAVGSHVSAEKNKRIRFANKSLHASNMALENLLEVEDTFWKKEHEFENKINLVKMMSYAIMIKEGNLTAVEVAKGFFCDEVKEYYEDKDYRGVDKSIDVIDWLKNQSISDSSCE
ncbi:MAG: Serine/threonine kinase [uncultured Sulfurovum sp.]|uniref:Serine/threonine kinase n=1 Tax=uncultured Sulfurovum sp. TaxID=269237 RepID=A0A6S6SX02_9BACT|nr:MAG: Serine/threonine kinase [uncultured Sulfurovum sp.]